MKFETQNEITAERLKELRKLNNLSQKELAKRTMIPYHNINKYELAKAQPSNETLIILANFYNVSVDFLLRNETQNSFQLGYLTEDKKSAIKILIALNQLNFVKAYSYISGLYAGQS